jgi:hypothetical protein
MAAVCLVSFGFDGPLLFQFSPVLVSSLRIEIVMAKIHVLPFTLRAGTVQHSPPVKLLSDLADLPVTRHSSERLKACTHEFKTVMKINFQLACAANCINSSIPMM